jgi:hypothetical protein
MRGFVSEGSPGEEPWPLTYVIVETHPVLWMATITLPDLAAVIDRRASYLRGVPYLWEGDELVVMFGPARVRGDATSWRSLAHRILAGAASSSELYEAPAARHWSGPTSELPVNRVEVAPRLT